ncbi:hypothetical protein ACRALDRAFT_208792 [Sodiomyces alcalophilus JCM 7366]|uniref:uncharacterized protein n=1 Tax=Sodiomyces alcalophilus JCM 7366 TaxID=591952 RepID=UPI0039B59602
MPRAFQEGAVICSFRELVNPRVVVRSTCTYDHSMLHCSLTSLTPYHNTQATHS